MGEVVNMTGIKKSKEDFEHVTWHLWSAQYKLQLHDKKLFKDIIIVWIESSFKTEQGAWYPLGKWGLN